MCRDTKNIRDPGSQDPGSKILEDLRSYVFIFFWDLRDLGSCYGNIAMGSYPRDLRSRPQKILLDPGYLGSSLRELSWDLADVGSYTTICHCILKIPDI